MDIPRARPRVIVPSIVEDPSSQSTDSTTSDTSSTTSSSSLYGASFLDNLRRAIDVLPHSGDYVLAPNSAPSSPSSDQRVEELKKSVVEASNLGHSWSLSMLELQCVDLPFPWSKPQPLKPARTILPLPETEEQWEHWKSGKEIMPPPMTKEESHIMLKKMGFRIPSGAAESSVATGSKKRKRNVLNDVRPIPAVTFRSVKRLTTGEKTPGASKSPSVPEKYWKVTPQLSSSSQLSQPDSPSRATGFIFPRPNPSPRSTSFRSTSTSQDISLRIDESPLPTPASFGSSIEATSSMSFTPAKASTPSRKITLTSSPITSASRTRAAAYRMQSSAPSQDVIPLDRQALRRMPTLEELKKQSSASKLAERKEAKKRKKFANLTASQSQSQSSEIVSITKDEKSPSSSKKKQLSLQRVAPEEEDRRDVVIEHLLGTPNKVLSPSKVDLTTPSHSQTTTSTSNTPITASAAKRRTFASVMSDGPGLLGFSSQFDFESKVDDISQFLKNDVDDVFLQH